MKLFLYLIPAVVFTLNSCSLEKYLSGQLKRSNTRNNITFLSDSVLAYELLEKEQKAIYELNLNLFKWTGSEEQLLELANLFESKGLNDKTSKSHIVNSVLNVKLPSRYENPISFYILENIRIDVEAEVAKFDSTSYNIGLGTLPYWSLNAKTYNRGSDELSLIIVNSGLFNFCHEMLKILLETISIKVINNQVEIDYSEDYLKKKLSSDPELLVRFSMALEDYSNHRVIKGLRTYSELESILLINMLNSMEFFTIAHEYGHLSLNHNPIEKRHLNYRNDIDSESKNIEYSMFKWKQEIEADLYALSLLKNYASKSNHEEIDFFSLNIRMPILFFMLSDIAETSKYIFKEKNILDVNANDSLASENSILMSISLCEEIINESESKLINSLKFPYIISDSASLNEISVEGTHPPDILRSFYLQSIIENTTLENKDTDPWSKLAVQLEKNLSYLWNELEPMLLQVLIDDILQTEQPNDSTLAVLEEFANILGILEPREPKIDSLENKGLTEWENKNYYEAIKCLTKVVEVDSSSFRALFFLGRSYFSIGDYNRSIEYFSLANNEMEYFWTYNNRGNAYRIIGELDKAESDLKMAISMSSNESLPYTNLGLVYFYQSKFEKAIEFYKKGIELNSNVPYYYLNLCEVYAIQGNYVEIENIQMAFEKLNPSLGDALLFKYLLYAALKLGNQDVTIIENELNNDLYKEYYIEDWSFIKFNNYLSSSSFNEQSIERILQLQNRIVSNQLNSE